MKKIIVATALGLVALGSVANAAEKGDFTPYVGMDYTYSDVNVKQDRPHYNSGSINVGTLYNRYFGTELFYQHSDTHKESNGADKSKTSLQGYGLDLMGYLPLGCDQKFSLIGTVGIAQYTVHKEYSFAKNTRDHGMGYRAGVGAMYNIDDNWSIRALARYVNFNEINDYDHMMEYSAGVRYSF